MSVPPEESELLGRIGEAAKSQGFHPIDPPPAVAGIDLLGAWKNKRLLRNAGIAVVSIGNYADPPGEFPQKLKRRIGRQIGYLFLLYPLTLQIIVVGRGLFSRSTELQGDVDTTATFDVILQAIHVVDVSARDELKGLPLLDDREHVEEMKPAAVQDIELMMRIKQPTTTINPMRTRLNYSLKTGRAACSARTWGLTESASFIDTVEEGITRFLHHPMG